ncbi:YqhA family protein [Argonema galeatum]|uniref:YqhA family protein n=1 Tax=Argonema galeatum TaxID=2942762 RepID=UPI0020113664|nr:YqhA family protein [Argonema galeatum]MCL1463591.1 YqhA family protein [Argonema galeatum A003/A1]
MRFSKKVEQVTENLLWGVRFLAIVPVLFGLVSVINLFWLGSLEIIEGVKQYSEFEGPHSEFTTKVMTSIIGGVDLYLIGIVLMLFSFGIYELFISKIDVGRANQEIRILEIHSLDELKDKILKVIVIVLVVRIFKQVARMPITTYQEILYLAIAILLIAASSYLLHSQGGSKHNKPSNHE